MNPLQYLNKLPNTLERKRILGVLDKVREQLQDYTLPEFHQTVEFFDDKGFQSAFAKALVKDLSRHFRFRGDQWLTTWYQQLQACQGHLDTLETYVKKEFRSEIASDALSFSSVAIIRSIEMLEFFVRYSRMLLLRLVGEEQRTRRFANATPPDWSRGQKETLAERRDDFLIVLKELHQHQRDFDKVLKNVSDAVISPDTYQLAEKSQSEDKLAPFRTRNFSVSNNPFFLFGKWLSEVQVKLFWSAKEERQALQLRLQELRELEEDGKASPKLQQHIRYTESRIEELNYRIQKVYDENVID